MSDDIEQGSPEWHLLRAGKVTASRIADLMAKTKTGFSASRANYAAQLVTERLTGRAKTGGFINDEMKWGTEQEPHARAAYEMHVGAFVEQVGFVHHATILNAGASPDGLVGDDGLVEIKCPSSATHIETLRGSSVDGKYILQMQWQMACTGRDWCDFVSYDPRLPASMQLFIRRIQRDDKHITEITDAVAAFLAEVDSTVLDLTTRYPLKEAA